MQAIKVDFKKKSSLSIAKKVESDLNQYFNASSKRKSEEEEAYYGVIWKNTSEYRPYENDIFDIIETAVPILSDGLPAPTVKTLDPERVPLANTLEKAIHWVNKDQNLELLYPEVVRNSLITGTGYIHPWYDHHDKNGQGCNKYEIVHWKKVKLAGNSGSIEDCSKARIELSRQKNWLKLEYPKFAKEIEDQKPETKEKSQTKEGKESTDVGSGYARLEVPKEYTDEDTLTLVKTFLLDCSLEKIPEEVTAEELEKEAEELQEGIAPDLNKWQNHEAHNKAHFETLYGLYSELGLEPNADDDVLNEALGQIAEANPEAAEHFQNIVLQIKVLEAHINAHEEYKKQNPSSQRLKYPGGYRQIDTINSLCVYDGKNKSWHNEIPLVPFYCYKNGGIYGHGMIRNILDSARLKTEMLWKEYKGLKRVANPSIELNQASGLDKDDVTNEDGGVYMVQEGTQWTKRYIRPGEINNQIPNFAATREQKMKDLSGMTNPTSGELPDARHSEKTVMVTQDQALGRIRLKDSINKNYSLKRLGKLVASDIVQYWTNEKVIEVAELDGATEDVIYNPIEIEGLEYDVEITTDTMSSIDRDKYNAFLTSLLNAGHLTFEQWAKSIDMPRSKQLEEHAKQNNEQAAQVQQMAEQIQQMQMQMIQLKVKAAGPESLSPEEFKIYEEVQRQETLANVTGLNTEQPEGAI